MSAPLYIDISFLTLAIGLYLLLIFGCRLAWKRANVKRYRVKVLMFTALTLGWLTLMGVLSNSGFFADFSSFPPRMALPMVVALLSIAVYAVWKPSKKTAKMLPAAWIVIIQLFRLPMELILWMLYAEGAMPVQMTYEGYNFDIITALTAPFVAYALLQQKPFAKKLAIVWNIAGLALLAIVVLIAVFSAPTPFRQFLNEPSTALVIGLPYIWLPGFVVPFAVLLHVISLKQMRAMRTPA